MVKYIYETSCPTGQFDHIAYLNKVEQKQAWGSEEPGLEKH